jgi:hypothetical protein
MRALRTLIRLLCAGVVILNVAGTLVAQDTTRVPAVAPAPPPAAAPKPWYERLSVRGYAQFRYNRLLESNALLQCDQCDRSWGESGGIFIRRARLVISGQVHPRVAVYLQPDFANLVGTSGGVAQLRSHCSSALLSSSRLYLNCA